MFSAVFPTAAASQATGFQVKFNPGSKNLKNLELPKDSTISQKDIYKPLMGILNVGGKIRTQVRAAVKKLREEGRKDRDHKQPRKIEEFLKQMSNVHKELGLYLKAAELKRVRQRKVVSDEEKEQKKIKAFWSALRAPTKPWLATFGFENFELGKLQALAEGKSDKWVSKFIDKHQKAKLSKFQKGMRWEAFVAQHELKVDPMAGKRPSAPPSASDEGPPSPKRQRGVSPRAGERSSSPPPTGARRRVRSDSDSSSDSDSDSDSSSGSDSD